MICIVSFLIGMAYDLSLIKVLLKRIVEGDDMREEPSLTRKKSADWCMDKNKDKASTTPTSLPSRPSMIGLEATQNLVEATA